MDFKAFKASKVMAVQIITICVVVLFAFLAYKSVIYWVDFVDLDQYGCFQEPLFENGFDFFKEFNLR